MAEMTPNTSNQPQNFDPTRRLKKVKRPVKRYVQGQVPGQQQPQMPSMQNPTNNQGFVSAPAAGGVLSNRQQDDFNIDNILDGDNNLPALAMDTEVNQSSNDFQPQFINESDIMPPKLSFMEQLMQGNMFTMKGMAFIAAAVFVVGFMFAKLFFAQQTIVRDGLQGVVFNPEVPRGRARCGVVERSRGCVLYIMNPQRQELSGRDFYDLASQLTSRQRFVIETGNMRYSNVKIRPGDIAQLNIPPLQ